MSKRTSIKLFALLLIAVFIIPASPLSMTTESNAAAHPFILVNESEYAELQSRASQEPWQSWKTTAIVDAESINYSTDAAYSTRVTQMRDIMESCALAYILDPSNRSTYAAKVYNTIAYWVPEATGNLYDELNGGNWPYYIPPASAYFSCVIALDIVYPSLSTNQRTTAESRLQTVHNRFMAISANWDVGVWGARGIWPLYKGDTTALEPIANSYYTALTGYLTNDGICTSGVGYANMRFNADRNTKQYFMDALTYTGVYDYYNDYKVKSFYEWMYGYGATPFKIQWVYGDSAYANTFYRTGSIYKADNFSTEAAKRAAWLLENQPAVRGRIFNYVLHRSSFPTPERPASRIFTDGGAFFNENSAASTALSSVLWNPKSKKDDHCHKEVNAMSLAGYGEYLLTNVGYNGWGAKITVGGNNFTWNYVNNRAVSNNTALINYSSNFNEVDPTASNDHALKYGNGITDGFTSPLFSYASGDSGSALSNGKHIRNMVFVGPQDSKNGYWVLFDEMTANTPGQTAHIALHPPSGTYSTVTSNQEYKWTMKKFSSANVDLSIFLATPPTSVAIKNGVVGSYGNSFATKYLYSTYNTDSSQGKENIVTVLFPHNASHTKAAMSRVSGSGYTGASINLDGGTTIDYALESAGTSDITYGGVTRRGFDATGDVSVYIKDKTGNISSSGTNVTFYYPNITGVKLNGSNAQVQSSGSNWVTVNVPAGTHTVEYTFGGTPTITPTPTPVPTITPIPTPTPDPDAWYGKASFLDGSHNLGTTNTGKLEVEFDITPLASGLNACTGYADSSTNITTWNDPSMTIRMNTSGTFDVRNGGAFAATTNVSYSPNNTYHVKMITDLAYKKYDVWITPPGGTATKITNNYSFRTDAPAIDDLGKINLKDDADNRYKVQNHTVTAAPPPEPVTFNPTADAFVRDGTEYEEKTHGTQVILAAKDASPASYNRKSYLKFNFSSLNALSVSNAKLKLYVYTADPGPDRSILVYGNINEGWSESTITWKNAPDQAGDTLITSSPATGTPVGTWIEFDVTSYINSQMSDKVVSLQLKNSGTAYITFNSREASTNKPQLVITP